MWAGRTDNKRGQKRTDEGKKTLMTGKGDENIASSIATKARIDRKKPFYKLYNECAFSSLFMRQLPVSARKDRIQETLLQTRYCSSLNL